MKKLWQVILGLLLTASLGFNFYFLREKEAPFQDKETFRVEEVLDGDSFIIPLDQTIRLANIDAPSLEFCFGREAKEALEEMILGKNVRIEKVGKDSYNRLLALVYLDDQFVNEILLTNGWAKYVSGGSNNEKITDLLKEKDGEAKENKRGVWSEECYQKENPVDPACNIKGNLGKHEHGEKKTYHYPGCAEYERTVVEADLGERWFCSEEEAIKAGFTKSEHCFKEYEKPDGKQ